MFTTRLSRILLAGLVCLLVLPLFPLSAWADEQSEAQFFAPTKESPYEGIPGRLRYNVRIVLVEQDKQGNYIARRDSSTVSKRQLAATVITAARYYAQEKRAAVVSITLDSQPGPAFGKTVLATAIYAPDGKGVSGSDDWTWSTLQATPRGLTAQELKIQRLWGEMRKQFQANGFTDEGRLTAAIAKKLKIPAEKVMLSPVFPEPFPQEWTD